MLPLQIRKKQEKLISWRQALLAIAGAKIKNPASQLRNGVSLILPFACSLLGYDGEIGRQITLLSWSLNKIHYTRFWE
jgi:hypothetical protein